MYEWSLLLFTICISACVGGFMFLGISYRNIANKSIAFEIMKLPLIVFVVISILGLFASFFHLGTPTNAFYLIRGFGRSWMSNEIVFTGIFILLVCLTTGIALYKKKINLPLIVITSIVGLIAVYCMASIYSVTRVNGWNSINTYLIFYGTIFTLGPVLCASLIGITHKDEVKKIMKSVFVLAIFGITIQVLGAVIFSVTSFDIQLVNGITAVEKLGEFRNMMVARWVLEIAGLALLGFITMSSMKKLSYSMIYIVLTAIIVGEAMNRYLFYVLGS